MKLGDWLISKGRITKEQLARALQDQGFFGGRLGNSLVKLGFVDEDTLGEYLADISRTPYAPPRRLEAIPPEVIAAVPARLAARYRIVPLASDGRKLHLAMRDPKDLIALDEIAFLTGLTIEPYVATDYRLIQAIERYYNMSLGTKSIPVTGGAPSAAPGAGSVGSDSKAPRSAASLPAAPAGVELGLDGLPLDADPEDFDQPFVGAEATVPSEQQAVQEPLPRSLSQWREAQQEMPEIFPEAPAKPAGRQTDPRQGASRGATGGPQPAPAQLSSGSSAVTQRHLTVVPTGAPGQHTMESIAGRLRAADARDEVFDAVLDFSAARFHRAALFVIQQDRVIGWSGRGEGLSHSRIRNVTVSLNRPSLFVFFRSGGEYFYGPVPDLPANARFYLDLGIPPPSRVLLLPLTIKDRSSALLYADTGPDAGSPPEIDVYRRLLRKAALALEVLILRNKIMMV